MLPRPELLLEAGPRGLPARTAGFEELAAALDRLISAAGREDAAEALRFPPVLPRSVLERNGYFTGFPHLAGCVHSFAGGPSEHRALLGQLFEGEPIGDALADTGLALLPAACYPVYPLAASRGPVPAQGLLFDVGAYCFRHEPSDEASRLLSFRQREYVRIGTADQVRRFLETWMQRASSLVASLGLAGRLAPAHDPFFGDGAAALSSRQLAGAAKFEMLLALPDEGKPGACVSFNDHGGHFAGAWNLRLAGSALACSACVGFGIERLVLALLAAHGPDSRSWPDTLQAAVSGEP